MHHRGFIFKRGLPEDLERLAEDHGVCISSSVAYFEDDLIYQAFGRCMILAPEIYGNPWLMRDDEYPKLARIYNLHKSCAPSWWMALPCRTLMEIRRYPAERDGIVFSQQDITDGLRAGSRSGWTRKSVWNPAQKK